MLDRIDLSEISFHLLAQTLQSNDAQVLTELGFSQDEIEALEALTLKQLRHLAKFGPRYLRLNLDHACFCAALARVQDQHLNDSTQEAFIRRGAPAGMLRDLFGLTKKEITLYRQQLGLFRPGRPRTPDDKELQSLQQHWSTLMDLSPPERYLSLAEASGLSLASIWQVADQLETSKLSGCRS